MNLASKSLFGDSVGDNTHPFESYTKYLANNGKSLDYVVTQMSFNEDNDKPVYSVYTCSVHQQIRAVA
jgi:predicted glutamine amidotransferase